MKGIYNFTRVKAGTQGYWYYPLMILIVNYTAIVLLKDVFSSLAAEKRALLRPILIVSWTLLYLFTSAHAIQRIANHPNWMYTIWHKRSVYNAKLKRINPNMRLIDNYDGIIAYALDFPTISSTGLATDAVGLEYKKKSKYLEYCLSRGYNVLACDSGYIHPPIQGLSGRTIYRHKKTNMNFVELKATPSAMPRSNQASLISNAFASRQSSD